MCVCQMYVVFCTAVTTNHHRKCDNENDFPHRKWFGQDGNLNRCSFSTTWAKSWWIPCGLRFCASVGPSPLPFSKLSVGSLQATYEPSYSSQGAQWANFFRRDLIITVYDGFPVHSEKQPKSLKESWDNTAPVAGAGKSCQFAKHILFR